MYSERQEGRLTICRRCGKALFSKKGEDKYTDGGYTKYNQFANNDLGWKCHWHTGWLCPECEEKYKEVSEKFINEVEKSNKHEIVGFFNETEENNEQDKGT